MAKLGQDCQRRVALIKQDSFYRELSSDELALAKMCRYNFDHPDAIDDQAMYKALTDILNGRAVKLPIHDYQEHKQKPNEFYEVQSADVVLFEGVLIFYFPKVRDMFHLKLFVDTDSDTRLSRRVVRDVRERGRPLEMVLNQYDLFVKPAFEEFCLPTKKYADMIIPRGADNEGEYKHLSKPIWRLIYLEFISYESYKMSLFVTVPGFFLSSFFAQIPHALTWLQPKLACIPCLTKPLLIILYAYTLLLTIHPACPLLHAPKQIICTCNALQSVAIGLINHNVAYLLASAIPTLKNGIHLANNKLGLKSSSFHQ